MESELTFKLLEAVNFAAEKHKFQKRKGDDSPYINHPIGVAYILHNEGHVRDLNVLIAGVLHEYNANSKKVNSSVLSKIRTHLLRN
jgi:(p)ppGpp synthase/HD superfamily hydrolase